MWYFQQEAGPQVCVSAKAPLGGVGCAVAVRRAVGDSKQAFASSQSFLLFTFPNHPRGADWMRKEDVPSDFNAIALGGAAYLMEDPKALLALYEAM